MYKQHHMPINKHQIHHQMHHHMHHMRSLCTPDKMIVGALIACSFIRGICIGMYLGKE